MASIVGIAIFSFFPVLQLVLYLSPNIGFIQTLTSILLTFEVGKAWLFTFIPSIILFLFVIWFDYRNKPLNAWIGIFLTFILILALGWSSHATAYKQLWGFFNHTTHFTAVSVWIGILFVISWFSFNHTNWLNFLKWYTPVAVICLVCTIVTGLIIMTFVVDLKEYPTSWMIPYGQALLIKHILIIPLLTYAMINGFLIKKKLMNDVQYNPIPWARTESMIILLIFSVTSVLGQQSPPHEMNVSSEEVSRIFLLLYQGQFQPETTVQLEPNPTSLSLCVLAALSCAMIVMSYIKKMPAIVSFLTSILLVVCVYLSLILSIHLI
ncbi:copper resistance D family protein [Bacillus sp. Marseille-P3661]|uniref:copper resistance D family protein n=1 Tax=Bacillus sp. Marseille-P3661 TaxID=1936234 RepID=UPI002155BADA|nr:CopD family protein [Bacillus sp. Marseille-P3661]